MLSVLQLFEVFQNRVQKTPAEITAAEQRETKEDSEDQKDLGGFTENHLLIITKRNEDISAEPLIEPGKLYLLCDSKIGSNAVRTEYLLFGELFGDGQRTGRGKVVSVGGSAGHGICGINLQSAGVLSFRSIVNICKNAGEMTQGSGLGYFLSKKAVIHLKAADADKSSVRRKKRKQQEQYLIRGSGQDKNVTEAAGVRLRAAFPGVIPWKVLCVKFQGSFPMWHDIVFLADFRDSAIEKKLRIGVGRAFAYIQA